MLENTWLTCFPKRMKPLVANKETSPSRQVSVMWFLLYKRVNKLVDASFLNKEANFFVGFCYQSETARYKRQNDVKWEGIHNCKILIVFFAKFRPSTRTKNLPHLFKKIPICKASQASGETLFSNR